MLWSIDHHLSVKCRKTELFALESHCLLRQAVQMAPRCHDVQIHPDCNQSGCRRLLFLEHSQLICPDIQKLPPHPTANVPLNWQQRINHQTLEQFADSRNDCTILSKLMYSTRSVLWCIGLTILMQCKNTLQSGHLNGMQESPSDLDFCALPDHLKHVQLPQQHLPRASHLSLTLWPPSMH